MENPTIAEMIDTAIHNYIRIKGKGPTLLVLNKLAYVALLAYCVDLQTGTPELGELGSKIYKSVEDLYRYQGMDIAVLQEPTKADNGKYKVKVMVH